MESNLLSIIILYDHGFEVSSKPDHGVRILKDDTLIIEIIHEDQLFHLKIVKYRAQSVKKKTVYKPVGVDIQV